MQILNNQHPLVQIIIVNLLLIQIVRLLNVQLEVTLLIMEYIMVVLNYKIHVLPIKFNNNVLLIKKIRHVNG